MDTPPETPSVPRAMAAAVVVAMLAIAFRALATYDPTATTTNAALELEHYFFGTAATWPPLALALCAFSLWTRRAEALAPRSLTTGETGIAAGLAGLALALLCWSRHTDAPHLLAPAAALALIAACAATGGRRARRAASVPAAFLLFAAPIPPVLSNPIVVQLQLWTTAMLDGVLWLGGADYVATGDLILRGDHAFQVIEACSGYRATLLMPMATLFYLELLGWSKPRDRILLLASPLIGFLWNLPRALSIVLGPESLLGRDHTLQGLAVTVLGVVTIAVLDVLLQRAGVGGPVGVRPPSRADATADLPGWPRARFLLVVAIAGVFVVLPGRIPTWAPEKKGTYALAGFPTRPVGWKRTSKKSDPEWMGSILFDERVESRYTDADGRWVEVFVAANHRLDAARTLISPRAPIPASGWEIDEAVRVDAVPGRVGHVRLRVRRDDRYAWVESWYEGLDRHATEIAYNALALDQSPLRRPETSFLVRIWTPESPGIAGRTRALERLQAFVDATQARLATANRSRFRSPRD
ncbi:MAG: exosortase/archaeosortase family protein [Myxococcota bacterium]